MVAAAVGKLAAVVFFYLDKKKPYGIYRRAIAFEVLSCYQSLIITRLAVLPTLTT